MAHSLNNESIDYLSESLLIGQELLSDICLQIEIFQIQSLKSNYLLHPNLSEIISKVGQFVELSTLMYKILLNRSKTDIFEIKENHIQLLATLNAIHYSYQKLDLIALEDLIKYELKDNLDQWKIKLIPQMKSLINS